MPGEWDADAIVVGSGFAGAVTACRLTEAKQAVCILERGRRFLPSDLPVLPDKEPASAGVAEGSGSDRNPPDFTRALWPLGQGLWDLRDLGDLVVGQAAGYGGGSLIYASVHLRAPEPVFERWPRAYSRGKLEDYYDLAAYMLDVQPMASTYPKTAQFERVAKQLGRPAFRPPLAVNFGPREENDFGVKQGICDMRGECLFGCSKRAKNTLDLNYLARAEESGAEVRTLAEVVSIEPVAKQGSKGYEVAYRDHLARGRIETVSAPYVFLCAGAVNTTELLLRNREAGRLAVTGRKLGTSFHPNCDEPAVVFDCDELQEPDRGPTITSSLLYDDGESWLLVQDGGMPTHLEPLLGILRSPLWLHRNGFRTSDATRAAVPQRIGYAELPFESLVDALSTLTGGAITPQLPRAHEVSQAFHAWARGGRDLRSSDRGWALQPDALDEAMRKLRQRSLDDIALASEPTLERLLQEAAKAVAPSLGSLMDSAKGKVDFGDIEAQDLAAWALRLGVQLLWGSQAGMVGTIARHLASRLMPETGEVFGAASDLVQWALDYRHGDGHTAVLLSMGRDSQPWCLELARRSEPAPGSRISGASSGAAGILVSSSAGVLVLADRRGCFEEGEVLLAGERAFGICASAELEDLSVQTGEAGESPVQAAAASAELTALRFAPLPPPFREGDPRKFRTDLYRNDQPEPTHPPPPPRAPESSLRAHRVRPVEPRELTTQELLLRDIARELKGELRTSPLSSFMGRRITVHSQGGCPMAETSDEGVTDPFGEVFGCPGLYVMDAAAFPTPVGVNPAATIAAVAEYKVARFISRVLLGREENEEWWTDDLGRAAEWANARRPQLDPIGAIQGGAPDHDPIGIEFKEVMTGTHRPHPEGGPESEIKTALTVQFPDLARALRESRRGAPLELTVVEGDIEIAGIADPALDASRSRLLLRSGCDESGGEWRTIEYWLEFEAGGSRFVLDGVKDIRDDARFDVWEDATTMTFTIARRNDLERPFRRGVLRLSATDFFDGQLRSFKATNVDGDPARQVWALTSFARLFFGHFVDVYVPGLGRLADVAKGLARHGHV